MATAVARRSSTAVAPRASRALVYRRAAAQLARRGGKAALLAAASEKHTITALGTAAALGYVQKNNIQVPHIEALGVDGSVGVALWLAGRYTKNKTMQHAATGALACAIKGAVVSGVLSPGGPAPAPQGAAPQARGVMGGNL